MGGRFGKPGSVTVVDLGRSDTALHVFLVASEKLCECDRDLETGKGARTWVLMFGKVETSDSEVFIDGLLLFYYIFIYKCYSE